MRHSLRFRITMILTCSILLLVLLCILANEFFLERFYMNHKTSSLTSSYHSVNLIAGTGLLGNGLDGQKIEKLEKLEASSAFSVYIISKIDSFAGTSSLGFVYPVDLEMNLNPSSKGTGIFRADSYKKVATALRLYIYGISVDEKNNYELLQSGDNKYFIYKMYDRDLDSYYLDLVGFLDNGTLAFIRSNYENINESVMISVRFMAIVGIIAAVLGSVAMFLFSRKFTQPVLELTAISDEMAGLNFERKYTSKRIDEIGKLGNSINRLSDKLETTISELKSANIELEHDIRHKTEIDEMRKEFLSNVSHELKTPIALIQGYAEGLQEGISDDPESMSFYCDVIIDEARKMNTLVKKLLTLNEIEFGRDNLDLSRFDIVEMVRTVISSLEVLTKSNDITVVFNDREPIYVWADEGLIEEVVTNYLSNAINHIDGRKILDIGFETDGDKVRVSVFNTGNTIPEDELENIWIKFYKTDKARTRAYGGSGIGLSIVRAVMEQHNQKCGVINHKAGVEFWFELDIKKDK